MEAKWAHAAPLFRERKKNVRFLTVIVWQTRRAKKSVAFRGSDMLSKNIQSITAAHRVRAADKPRRFISAERDHNLVWGWMEEKTLYTHGSEGRGESGERGIEGEGEERDGGTGAEKSAMCLCEWKIGKEVKEKAAKSEAGRYWHHISAKRSKFSSCHAFNLLPF